MGFLSNLLGCECNQNPNQHLLTSAALTDEELVRAAYDYLKAKKRLINVDFAHYKDHKLTLTGHSGAWKLQVLATPSYNSNLPASGVING